MGWVLFTTMLQKHCTDWLKIAGRSALILTVCSSQSLFCQWVWIRFTLHLNTTNHLRCSGAL